MKHDVTFTIPERDLGKADVKFEVKRGPKIGTLKVSKGGVEWVTRDYTIGKFLSWKDFDDLMKNQGEKE